MKSDDIFDGVTDIRDDLINGAREAPRKKRRTWRRRMGAVAAVLALAILAGVLLRPGGALSTDAIALAEYPEMVQYPYIESYDFDEKAYTAWRESVSAQRRELGDISGLQSFFERSSQAFLSGAEGENRVYSPLNAYLALAMLAQLTDGDSREQILAALGSGGMEELRQQANDVWNANYRDDGALTSVLASSLWLSEDIKFNQDTLDSLARDFYASSYRGEMGSQELNEALQNWLNEQTGGLLQEQAGNIRLDSRTVLALASTVYFRAKWYDQFSAENTSPQVFHSPDGDVETDFMHEQGRDGDYFWGENFSALAQSFDSGGAMWFILPGEGLSPEELLTDPEALEFLFAADKYDWENQNWLYVDKSIPKFDVASQFDLGDGLKALGVTDIFDPALSDFSPMSKSSSGIVLSQADHAARVVIDEEGCTAASYITMALAAGRPMDEKIDFVLDRPFLFCITGDSGLPLFVGVVNNPAV